MSKTPGHEKTVRILKDIHEILTLNVKHGYVTIIDVEQAKQVLLALDDRILNLTKGRQK